VSWQQNFIESDATKFQLFELSFLRVPIILERDSGKHDVAGKNWKHNTANLAKPWVKLQPEQAEVSCF